MHNQTLPIITGTRRVLAFVIFIGICASAFAFATKAFSERQTSKSAPNVQASSVEAYLAPPLALVVNDIADTGDTTPGDGICDTNASAGDSIH